MKPASTADSALQARMQQAAWLLMALALLACLKLALLPALFAGLLVYELVHILAGWLPRWLPKRLLRGRFGGQAKLLAVGALTALVLAGLFASAAGLWTFYRSDAGSLPSLLQRMAEIIASLPPWLSEHLPSAPEGIHQAAIDWLLQEICGRAGIEAQLEFRLTQKLAPELSTTIGFGAGRGGLRLPVVAPGTGIKVSQPHWLGG